MTRLGFIAGLASEIAVMFVLGTTGAPAWAMIGFGLVVFLEVVSLVDRARR